MGAMAGISSGYSVTMSKAAEGIEAVRARASALMQGCSGGALDVSHEVAYRNGSLPNAAPMQARSAELLGSLQGEAQARFHATVQSVVSRADTLNDGRKLLIDGAAGTE